MLHKQYIKTVYLHLISIIYIYLHPKGRWTPRRPSRGWWRWRPSSVSWSTRSQVQDCNNAHNIIQHYTCNTLQYLQARSLSVSRRASVSATTRPQPPPRPDLAIGTETEIVIVTETEIETERGTETGIVIGTGRAEEGRQPVTRARTPSLPPIGRCQYSRSKSWS